MKTQFLLLSFLTGNFLTSLLFPPTIVAQIVPDATLPNNSAVVNKDNITNISGGTQAGGNLFHSFEQFSVPTGNTANFNNTAEIQNIFSRVTGTSASNIDGILRANGTANLFLLNPNGIVFGPNAELDLGGSFLGTTASSINFADGIQFSTNKPQASPLLTVSVPVGLGFSNNPKPITVQRASLNALKEKTLALVGGNLELQGSNLKAESGRIELGSVGETGTVQLNLASKGFALDYKDLSNFRDLKLSQEALVNVSGEGSGDVQLQGRQVTLTDNSRVDAKTWGAKPGGDLTVNASDSVSLIRGFSPNLRKLPGLFNATLGSGKAGKLTINTEHLLLQDGAVVSTSTVGQGQGGDLIVNASKTVSVSGIQQPPGQSSALLSVASSSGNAGNIIINTKQLVVKDGGVVSASTGSSGNGGNLIVNALDSVEVKGTSPSGRTLSSLRAEARAEFNPANNFRLSTPTGSAGDLKVVTNSFSVKDGALVSVSNEGPGNAGQLEIQADRMNINKGAISASSNSGEGGNMFLHSDSLQLLNSSSITTSVTGGMGNGGNINLDTNLLTLTKGSSITANAFRGNGGNIQIATQGLFQSPDSPITATSELGINGDVKYNIIENNPTFGTIELSQSPVDATRLIVQSCPGNLPEQSSSFTITGRGGLQPTPFKPLEIEPTPSIYMPSFEPSENRSPGPTSKQGNSSKDLIRFSFFQPVSYVQADTISRDSQGNVVFSSSAPPKRAFPTLNCEIFDQMNK